MATTRYCCYSRCEDHVYHAPLLPKSTLCFRQDRRADESLKQNHVCCRIPTAERTHDNHVRLLHGPRKLCEPLWASHCSSLFLHCIFAKSLFLYALRGRGTGKISIELCKNLVGLITMHIQIYQSNQCLSMML